MEVPMSTTNGTAGRPFTATEIDRLFGPKVERKQVESPPAVPMIIARAAVLATLASLIPAARAARVDAMQALRAE
jgi:hypothetical protein